MVLRVSAPVRLPLHIPEFEKRTMASGRHQRRVVVQYSTTLWAVTGIPVAALVVPASTHENRASELMLEHLGRQGVTDRL